MSTTATTANMDDRDERDRDETSATTDDSNTSTAAAALTQQPRSRMGAVDVDWLFSAQVDNALVTVKCGIEEKSFVVLKSILTKNSDFFEKCLNKPWSESTSLTVHLPNIKPDAMELYLTLTTRQALMNLASKDKSLVHRTDFQFPTNLCHHLRLFMACDYLQNQNLATGVHEMFLDYIRTHSKPQTEDGWEGYLRVFADAFDLLEPGHRIQRRLQRRIVKTFCTRVSSELYFTHCKILREHHAFVFEVTQQFALNAMWNHTSTKAKADEHKAQRMKVDDDSEAEE